MLELVETVDILAELGARPAAGRPGRRRLRRRDGRRRPASVLEHGRAKARRKGADLLVVNAVGGGRGFGTDVNDVTILDGSGAVVAEAAGSKDEVADAVWDAVLARG